MKEVKFRINCFGCRTSEGGTVSAEHSKGGPAADAPMRTKFKLQPANRRATGRRAMRVATCLAGFLVLAAAIVFTPATSSAQMTIGVSVSFGPPALPVYTQPLCPAPGYIWTPGYWAWDPAYGYYWIPGTWVPAPFVGALWTPGYWGYRNGMYVWYSGYWGTLVGYYGGINYGYGYTGQGYYGGYWNRGVFYYNRSVNRITTRSITHFYSQRVAENARNRYVSYHGGPGGTTIGPTAGQLAAARERRFGAVSQQVQLERFAQTSRAQRASVNHGRPDIAATPRPEEFRGSNIVRATRAGTPYREPSQSSGRRPATSGRVIERAPSTPHYTPPPARTERPAPTQQRPERQEQRYNRPPAAQHNQVRSHQPESRQPAGPTTRERAAHSSHKVKHEGGHNHNR